MHRRAPESPQDASEGFSDPEGSPPPPQAEFAREAPSGGPFWRVAGPFRGGLRIPNYPLALTPCHRVD